ncbi:hypothetical protein DAPPUDRAFT_115919 [Daphnia pulex]|uniref:Uncharacterized protein n=1 Tax=Daphnia pulex TaxID=6669 RepID=E9HMZ1_DAPPU|nr:hypothetical protein DAPPUDRAFT_115919 [Daphnia pulex]|eukprot:EFX66897.1 hypothetical protein DAPPUDRAFT_115919 [Daphnia pulex]
MSICDCTKPVTRGLLDLTDPEYCFKLHNAKEDGYKSMSKPVNYKVVTTMDTVLKLKGLVCSQWIETKRITGSFRIGSYDTEHFHTTKSVDPKECWDMKLQLNCGGNRNVVNAQDIELRQEYKDGPILSPFGAHNVSLEAEKLFINHNTLVWHKPNQGYSANNCKPKTQFISMGRLSLITVETDKKTLNLTRTGRLLDSEKQIEILFDPKPTFICTNINNAYKVTGIPDTYVVFGDNVEKYFPPIPHKKQRFRRQTALSETDKHSLSLAWGHINPLSFFPPTEFDEKFENKEYVVTTSEVENPLFLMPRVPPFNASIWHELGICPAHNKNSNHLLFKDCSISRSTWIYDAYRMYFMEAETRSCLTAVKDKVELLPCEMEPHSVKQMWKFDFKNMDETFQRTYPNITIEEWEFVQEELQSRPAESDTEVEDLFNWGSFIQRTQRKEKKENSTCLTHSANMRIVTLELCTKQDTEFSKQNQMFEYATDYTIRKFTSNMCLNLATRQHSSISTPTPVTTVATLIDCNNNSMSEFNGLSQSYPVCHFGMRHRNLSIYAIPFPPLPPIIQRANTVKTPKEEPDTTTSNAATSTTTTVPTTTPQPTTTTTSTTTPKPTTPTTTTTTTTSTTTTTTTQKPTTSIHYVYNDDTKADYVYNNDDAKAEYVHNDYDYDANAIYVHIDDKADAIYVYNDDGAEANYVNYANDDDAEANYIDDDNDAEDNYVDDDDADDAEANYASYDNDADAGYVYNYA